MAGSQKTHSTQQAITWTSWLLRIGLAFVFLYAAIASFVRPDDWIGFLPGFATTIVDPKLLLDLFSIAQIVLAVWLLTGWWLRYAALFAAAMLAGIILANPTQLLLTFRDIGLLFAAVALAILSWHARSE